MEPGGTQGKALKTTNINTREKAGTFSARMAGEVSLRNCCISIKSHKVKMQLWEPLKQLPTASAVIQIDPTKDMIDPYQHVKLRRWMNSEAVGEDSLQVDRQERSWQDLIGQAGSWNFC